MNWKSEKILVLIVLVAAAIGYGCVGEPGKTDADAATPVRAVTDDLGREVRLPVKIERAVSLAPSLTETIFAVGAGDRLVGVTTYCNYPAETQAIQKVGDTQTPNVENIIALRPQVVFVSTASQLEAFMRTLDERGIAVFVTNATKLDDVFRQIHLFGELFATRERAGTLLNELQERVASVRAIEGKQPIGVFLQISQEPLFTIGRDSFLTEMVEIAGGKSVTADVPSGYPKLSKETASALNPDLIILSDSEDNKEPNDVFKNSAAMRNGRVYRIDPDIISRPGPRSVDALEEIASVISRPTN